MSVSSPLSTVHLKGVQIWRRKNVLYAKLKELKCHKHRLKLILYVGCYVQSEFAVVPLDGYGVVIQSKHFCTQ